jgi:hypothetical protein
MQSFSLHLVSKKTCVGNRNKKLKVISICGFKREVLSHPHLSWAEVFKLFSHSFLFLKIIFYLSDINHTRGFHCDNSIRACSKPRPRAPPSLHSHSPSPPLFWTVFGGSHYGSFFWMSAESLGLKVTWWSVGKGFLGAVSKSVGEGRRVPVVSALAEAPWTVRWMQRIRFSL